MGMTRNLILDILAEQNYYAVIKAVNRRQLVFCAMKQK